MSEVLDRKRTKNPYAPPAATGGTGDDGKGGNVGRGAWLALAAALLGWLFDGAEMGVFSLVGRPALMELMNTSDDKVIAFWIGVIVAAFLVGAATGGVLFGWLGDRIGRVRAMTLSVLTYAVFTGLCGFANEAWQVGTLRFIAALGMGGEWSLGVALVMEIWPNRSRAFMAGLIGAAANVGYLLIAVVGLGIGSILESLKVGLGAVGLPPGWIERFTANEGWRIIMILGTVPALLTFFIRVFVPESHKWEEEQKRGATSNSAVADLLGVLIGLAGPALIVFLWAAPLPKWLGDAPALAVRLVGTVAGLALAVCGYAFPMMRYLQRQSLAGGETNWQPVLRRMLLASALGGVALLGTWGSTQTAPAWAHKLADEAAKEQEKLAASDAQQPDEKQPAEAKKPKGNPAKSYALIWLSVGAIIGTLAGAFLGDWLGRRITYCLLCVASLSSVFLLFMGNHAFGPWLLAAACLSGACTASFYGWLPLYLPELFPTNVRATGQGFSFNFGRILAAVGVLQLGNLVGWFEQGITLGPLHLPGGYPSACSIISLVYFVGMAIIWFAPETHGKPLPE